MDSNRITASNAKCMRETGASEETTKKTYCQRRGATVEMDKQEVSEHDMRKMLHQKDTANVLKNNYAIGVPIRALFTLAGCRDKEGGDYYRESGIAGASLRNQEKYPNLVFSTLPSWFKEEYMDAINNKTKVRHFMVNLFESMAQFVEAAAMFRIKNTHQDYHFYKYSPFNITGGEFEAFVVELQQAFGAQQPGDTSMDQARHYVHAGKFNRALQSANAAHTVRTAALLQQNNEQNNELLTDTLMRKLAPVLTALGAAGGPDVAASVDDAIANVMGNNITSSMTHVGQKPVLSSATAALSGPGAASGAAAAPAIDNKDPSTWPDDPDWLKEINFGLMAEPRELKDLYDEWHSGHANWPALHEVEKKYNFHWRKGLRRLGQRLGYRRALNENMPTLAQVAPLQKELDDFWDDEGAAGHHRERGMKGMRRFLEQVLRKRKAGFEARSLELKRRKIIQKSSSKREGTNAGSERGGAAAVQ